MYKRQFQRRTAPPPVPFQAPRTRFNAELSPNRRFAYTSVSLDEVKRVRKAFDVKVNDVVLALCAGSLRRWLAEHDEIPSSPLIAQVPVSVVRISPLPSAGWNESEIRFVPSGPGHLMPAGREAARR